MTENEQRDLELKEETIRQTLLAACLNDPPSAEELEDLRANIRYSRYEAQLLVEQLAALEKLPDCVLGYLFGDLELLLSAKVRGVSVNRALARVLVEIARAAPALPEEHLRTLVNIGQIFAKKIPEAARAAKGAKT